MNAIRKQSSMLVAVMSVILFGFASPALAESKTGLDNDLLEIATTGEAQLSLDEMESNRGAAGLVFNNFETAQTLESTSSGNSFNVGGNVTNGTITIGDQFSGGMGSYVMNTGNNSTITSAVSMNIQILPPTP